MKITRISSRRWTTPADYLVASQAKRVARPRPSPARYFFHLRDGGKLVSDQDGMILHGMDEIRQEAIRGAEWIIASATETGGSPPCNSKIEVQDEIGRVVYELQL